MAPSPSRSRPTATFCVTGLAVHLCRFEHLFRRRHSGDQPEPRRRPMSDASAAPGRGDLLVERALIDGEWVAGDASRSRSDDPFTSPASPKSPTGRGGGRSRGGRGGREAFPAWAGKTAQEPGVCCAAGSSCWSSTARTSPADPSENGKTSRSAGRSRLRRQFSSSSTRRRHPRARRDDPGRGHRAAALRSDVSRSACRGDHPRGTSRWRCSPRKVGGARRGCTIVAKPARRDAADRAGVARWARRPACPGAYSAC